MSIPIEISESCIDYEEEGDEIFEEDCVYPFGVDHSWYLATNELQFLNSMKMKLSVIFGVSQMSLGIFMKAMNAIHFRQKLDFLYEFIPQIILLLSLFGFLDLLIIVKWLTPWDGRTDRAPGIISLMISMFLNFGQIDTDTTDSIIGEPSTQQTVCILLLIIALFCVPTMLIVKPWFIYKELQDENHSSNSSSNQELQEYQLVENPAPEPDQNKPLSQDDIQVTRFLEENKPQTTHNFSEICIHQLIETIEFVLGTVSNTASYLRLWALSLAHGQLAHVFFSKLLESLALSGSGSPILLFVLFPVFFSFTFFVLMCMDSMECFLHTLRLHWVEFQNKFYKGNGYRFVPFSFENLYVAGISQVADNVIVLEEEVDSVDAKSEIELPDLVKEDDVPEEPEDDDDVEEEFKKVPEKEDDGGEDPKEKLYQELLTFKNDISINKNNLGDARDRLTNLQYMLTTNSDTLKSVNIQDSDPASVLNPQYDYLASFDDYSSTQQNLDSNITDAEVFITKVENLSANKSLLENYTQADLQDLILQIENMHDQIITINKNLESHSLEQSSKIQSFENFLTTVKEEQYLRCDLEQNKNLNGEIESKCKFCSNLLDKVKIVVNQKPNEMSERREQVFGQIEGKISEWEQRYSDSEEGQKSLAEVIESIQVKIDENKEKTLDMQVIREIVASKQENLDKNQEKLDEIEALIQEIKALELEFTECEERDQVRQSILDELLPKVDDLKEKYQKFQDDFEVVNPDLSKLEETLRMTIDHEDYSERQEGQSKFLTRVEEKISTLNSLNDTLKNHDALNEIVADEEYTISLEIPYLESKLHNVNKIIKKLDSTLESLQGISADATSFREELNDVYTGENSSAKQEEFGAFKIELASLIGKFEMVQSRLGQEKEDPRLQDNHMEVISEVEASLQQVGEKIEELKLKETEDQDLLNQIQEKISNTELATCSYDDLQELIKLIEQVKVSEVDALGPVNRLSAQIDDAILSLDKIDYAQENNPANGLIDNFKLSTEELLKNIRFMKSVFDSTEGYTSSQEEDTHYDQISNELKNLIVRLLDVNEKVDEYKANTDFSDVNDFLRSQEEEIQQIQEALFNHSLVLQQIPWAEKLGRRVEELKEEQADVEDILEDGQKIKQKLEKMKNKAEKNEEANAELIEKIDYHHELVSKNLEDLENKKEELDSIEDDIKEFETLLENRNDTDFTQITQLLKTNKQIKEKIDHIDSTMDALDAEIDEVAPFISENKKLIKKKYKVKKGDEIDEVLADFLNNSDLDIPIKRTGDGKYMIGDKKISASLRNGKLLIRVGGGYVTLQEYMETFGNAKLKRNQRKEKRDKRKNRKQGRKPRVLNKTGDTDVVGSQQLIQSMMEE